MAVKCCVYGGILINLLVKIYLTKNASLEDLSLDSSFKEKDLRQFFCRSGLPLSDLDYLPLINIF